MAGPQDLWAATAEAFDTRYDAVGDRWDDATPCDEWTVRQLVDHATGVQAMMGGALGGQAGAEDGWPAIRDTMASALAEPGALDGNIDHPALGTMPRQQVLGIAIADLLIHTWDLSRAIGADETLPSDVVPVVYQGLQAMPAEFVRAPGRFDDAIDAPGDADTQTQMLLFAGRQV